MTELLTASAYAEYDAFIQSHPKGHFMQSRAWANVKSAWTWDAIVCRDEKGAIKGSLALLTRKIPGLPTSLCYGCRGPVCDIDDKETLSELIKGAVDYAKKKKAYLFKLDPDVPSSEEDFKNALTDLGFAPPSDSLNFEGIQPRYVFRLTTEGQSEDSLMEAFESKTRYNIRLAARKGVEVRIEQSPESISEFGRIMRTTGERDNFVVRTDSYFANMLDALGENARLYMAYHEGKAIAGTLAIGYGDKVWYLYGASSNAHRNLMPNYLLQWHMIRWAIEVGARVYDFRGVSGDLSEDNPLYGLYRFKKGFNGEFTEFVGEFEYRFKPLVNAAITNGEKLYRKARKLLFLRRNK